MGKGITIRLIGKDALIAALGKVRKNLHSQVNREVKAAALRTVAKAKMRLQPEEWDSKETVQNVVDVRQSINFLHDPATLSASVHAGNVGGDDTPAYLEFGTGPYAERYVRKLPNEIQQFAMNFWVNGEGTTSEHPYLIPSWMEEGEKMKDKLKGLKLGWK